MAKLISDAIDAVFEDTSVSEIFGGDNLAEPAGLAAGHLRGMAG